IPAGTALRSGRKMNKAGSPGRATPSAEHKWFQNLTWPALLSEPSNESFVGTPVLPPRNRKRIVSRLPSDDPSAGATWALVPTISSMTEPAQRDGNETEQGCHSSKRAAPL